MLITFDEQLIQDSKVQLLQSERWVTMVQIPRRVYKRTMSVRRWQEIATQEASPPQHSLVPNSQSLCRDSFP
jgi:hypothetical protein